MKNKNKLWFYPLVMMGVLLILTSSCKKDDNNSPSNLTNGKTTAVFNQSKTYGTVTDFDGNVYKTITISTQTWMAENLRTTHYQNGEAIPEVTDNTAWPNLSTGAYCNYKNTRNNDTIATFGRLYNWYTVSVIRNIAPTGWHVPNDAEWATLTTYLGGESVAEGKMKETGTTHWESPSLYDFLYTGATNESGFTALPGGARNLYEPFLRIGSYGYWWSSTEYNADSAWSRAMAYNYNNVYRLNFNKKLGFSVRCIKD